MLNFERSVEVIINHHNTGWYLNRVNTTMLLWNYKNSNMHRFSVKLWKWNTETHLFWWGGCQWVLFFIFILFKDALEWHYIYAQKLQYYIHLQKSLYQQPVWGLVPSIYENNSCSGGTKLFPHMPIQMISPLLYSVCWSSDTGMVSPNHPVF